MIESNLSLTKYGSVGDAMRNKAWSLMPCEIVSTHATNRGQLYRSRNSEILAFSMGCNRSGGGGDSRCRWAAFGFC